MRRVQLAAVVLVLATIACLSTGPRSIEPVEQPTTVPSPTQPPATNTQIDPGQIISGDLNADQIDAISKASVQIFAARQNGEVLWSGSGTIVSPTGEIITNCHVACDAPVLIILMTTQTDRPPEESYIAEVTHAREDIDLAILQITTDVNGNPVSPTNLPYLEIGDSNALRLGDKIYIFGYPGVGGDTITFTTGSVSGFEIATVDGSEQRLYIKTDADIAGGNSGGTAVDLNGRLVAIPSAVNPDIREGVTLGGIGLLLPANLVATARSNPGGATTGGGAASLPPSNEPDPYEPNDDYDEARGPLAPGDVIEAYISWENDIDVFYINTSTTQPITLSLTNIPAGTDYDLYLLDEDGTIAFSENETQEEYIEFSPRNTGTYWIAVVSYSGASTSQPYTLAVNYDGGGGGGSKASGGIAVSGRAMDADNGRPLQGGVFGILEPGVTCNTFLNSIKLDFSLVITSTETDSQGRFLLDGVPRGESYTTFFIYGDNQVCENDWLEVPSDATDTDIGEIKMSF